MGTVPAGPEKRADAAGGRQRFRSPTAVIIWWVWLLFAAANLVDLAVQGRDHASLVAAAILLLATGVAYVTAQRPRIIADDAGITIRNPLRDHHVGWAGVAEIDLADLLRVHCRPGPGDQRGKVIGSWAVHYSRRRRLVTETRARRANARATARRSSLGPPYGSSGPPYGSSGPPYGGSGPSYGGSRGYGNAPGSPPASAAEAEAEKVVRLLSERATAARAEEVWAQGTVPIAGAAPGTGEMTAAAPADVDLAGTGWLEPLKSTWSRPAIAALIIPALSLLIVSLL